MTRRFLAAFGAAFFTLGLLAPMALACPPGTFEVPRSIDANGKKDVTDDLLAYFASVPDGSTITFPDAARYRIEGTLYMFGRTDLTFDGNGATFFATTDGTGIAPPDHPSAGWVPSNNWPRHRAQWIVDRSERVTFRNLTITGANPNAGPWNGAYVSELEAQHGIEMAGSSGLIDNVSISDTYGDLVSVTRWAHDVTVQGSTLVRSGRQGVTVDGGVDVVIRGNTVADTGRSIFDLEPPTAKREVRRVLIEDNDVGRANGIFVAALGKGVVDDVMVRGNRLTGQELTTQVRDGQKNPDGTQTSWRHNWAFVDNVSDRAFGSPQAMLRFWRVNGITVTGNRAPIALTQSRKAVETWKSCDIVAEPNDWVPSYPEWKSEDDYGPIIPLTTDGYESSGEPCG